MRNIILLAFIAMSVGLNAQSPVGIWKNLDDTDGKEKSHIEIYESGGVLKAKSVSYTHLDVYKRQIESQLMCSM